MPVFASCLWRCVRAFYTCYGGLGYKFSASREFPTKIHPCINVGTRVSPRQTLTLASTTSQPSPAATPLPERCAARFPAAGYLVPTGHHHYFLPPHYLIYDLSLILPRARQVAPSPLGPSPAPSLTLGEASRRPERRRSSYCTIGAA